LEMGVDGRKTVLGLREGATENATVVSELLSDLAGRGLEIRPGTCVFQLKVRVT
jgi:transposase-like protein